MPSNDDLDNASDPEVPDELYKYFGKTPPRRAAAPELAPPPPAADNVVPIRTGSHDAYINAALTREIGDLAATASGGRNHALNVAALKLAGLPIDRNQLRADLISACHANGLVRDDGQRSVEATIDSAFAKADRDGPRDIPDRPTINGHVTEVGRAAFGAATDGDGLTTHPIWGGYEPIDAATYLFDQEETTTALWGSDEHILWAEGEALMIAGGMGLGKTTLAGQIIRALLGLERDVLGLPVATADGPILYLAMDRPRQIRRSMLRQFDRTERDQITHRLLIRPGPPVADIAARPTLLAEMAFECGATTIFVDSLKDAAIGLSSDEVGAAYNRARQFVLAQGVQLCELHHLIKRNPMGGAPTTVADVYGSNWLTAGAGSVVMLTGDPGDPIINFRHVKQPHDEVGPWRLLHDTAGGRFSVDHEVDLVALASASGAQGLTAQGAAAAIFERDKPTRAQIEKARRRLDKLANAGQLVRIEGMKGGADGGVSANYFTAQ